MFFCRSSAIITVEHIHVVRIRTEDKKFLHIFLKRKNAFILEQNHGFTGTLDSELIIGFAAYHFRTKIRPRKHLGRIEHTKFKTSGKDLLHMDVKIRLLYHTILKGVLERYEADTALKVRTVKNSICRSMLRIRMGFMLTLSVEIVDGVAVCKHDSVISPFVAKDIYQKSVICAARDSFVTLISTHNLSYVCLCNKGFERRKICLPKVTLRNAHIHSVTKRFRTAVDCIMLRTGVGLVVLVVIALHTLHGLNAHHAGKVWILARSFLTSTPSRVPYDIDIRAPE